MTKIALPEYADVVAAAERLQGYAVRTPVIRNDHLDHRTGRKIFLKIESLQRTGTFKFRGAFNRLVQLNAKQREAGVVAFSSGNHAQGVAHAAQLLGIPAAIVMPENAPAIKIANTRGYGAELLLYDRKTEDREKIARKVAEERGRIVVPSYDDFHIISGQGTIGLEMMQYFAEIDVVPDAILTCCGGGGLTAGSSLAIKKHAPDTQIYTVEPDEFDDTARSLASGEIEGNDPDAHSICDALLTHAPGAMTFAINRENVAAGLAVTDDEVRRAISYAFRHLKIVLEPGGAVTLAAALAGKLPDNCETVGLICSGGNIDDATFIDCLTQFPEP